MPLFFRSGQQLKNFKIYRKTASSDRKGRMSYTEKLHEIGTLKGSISFAGQREINRFKQIEHPISHTIIVHGYSYARPDDILTYNDEIYYIYSSSNPSELKFFQILYCEKRSGLLNPMGISSKPREMNQRAVQQTEQKTEQQNKQEYEY